MLQKLFVLSVAFLLALFIFPPVALAPFILLYCICEWISEIDNPLIRLAIYLAAYFIAVLTVCFIAVAIGWLKLSPMDTNETQEAS